MVEATMLSRIIGHSLMRRRRHKLLSLIAVALGVSVATALATIALDVGDKVSRELRSFGANISVTAAADGISVVVGGVDYRPLGSGAFLAEDDLVKLKRIFWRNNILAFAPYLPVPVSVKGHRVTLVGTWFEKHVRVDRSEVFSTGLERIHPAWKVQGQWPKEGDTSACLVGQRVAGLIDAKVGQVVAVQIPLRIAKYSDDSLLVSDRRVFRRGSVAKIEFQVGGILETGGPEDDQVLAPLAAVQKAAGLEGKVRRVEVSALTKPEDAFARSDPSKMTPEQFEKWNCSPYVRSIAYQIEEALPGAEARPVFQVADTEGRILDRIRVLMGLLSAAALLTGALAVASVMLAAVLERQAEIGLFKSLGATHARVATIFLLEGAVIGCLGGLAGYVGGSLLAWRLAITVFGLPVGVHWVMLPAAVALALLVTLMGSALPLARGLKVSAAVALRD